MIYLNILLTVKKQSCIFTLMTTQQPTPAPDRFVRLLRLALASQSLSLRKVAGKAGISPAYLSRLVNGERGLPTDDTTIAKLEQVLDFPPGRLFDAAERPDLTAKTFLKKQQARPMLRSLAPLSDDDLAKVLKVAEKLAKKHHPDQK
jgi:transcriptional regulator with XRE-family HTH domain